MLLVMDGPSILSAAANVAVSVLHLLLYFWAALVVYNLVSAIFGLCILRRVYIDLLRKMYRLFGFKAKGSVVRGKSVRFPNDTTEGNGGGVLSRRKSAKLFKGEFHLGDIMEFVHDGIDVIIEDEVTKCFSTEVVEEWNFLSRTKFQFKTKLGCRMELLLVISVIFRFSIFIIIRLPIAITSVLWLIITMVALSIIRFFFPKSEGAKYFERHGFMVCNRLMAAALSAVVNIHHRENRAKMGSVCVANHTTPIDIVVLAVDNCFSLVAQRHGGFVGLLQKSVSLAQEHVWFERKIASDRRMVANRLKQHVRDPMNNPILIFPEGTCINNTSVFMFKKGCFEVGATIFPVVIKYHREFADPYWNSQEQNIITYLAMLMTSWAIVCDIDYLSPTTLREGETAIEFASRVKADICRHGGLVDLPWDGMIKRPGTENYLNKLIEEERKMYREELLDCSKNVEKEPEKEEDEDSEPIMMAKSPEL